MGTDILALLHRDHEDLQKGLITLLDRTKSIGQIRIALDGIRLGLTAHAEAEDIVFSAASLGTLIEGSAKAHRDQERALAVLVVTALGSHAWFARASTLLGLVHDHAAYDERHVLPAIRELAPGVYPTLAGLFATERLHQLSMLLPSAPVAIPDLASVI